MKKKKKRGRILPFVTLLLLCLGLLMLINFERFSRAINSDYYEEVDAKIVETGGDPLVGIIPRIKVSYVFGDTKYEYNKVLYTRWLYAEGIGEKIKLYVNKKAPENSVFEFHFFTSITNIILLIVEVFSMGVIIMHIRRRLKNSVKKKEC